MNIRYSRFVFAAVFLAVIGVFVAQSTNAQEVMMPSRAPVRSTAPAIAPEPLVDVAPAIPRVQLVPQVSSKTGAEKLAWPGLMDVSELDVRKTQLYVVLRSDSFLSHASDASFDPFSSESPSVGADTVVYAGVFMHINNNSTDPAKLINTLKSLNYYIAFNQGPIGSVPAIYSIAPGDFNVFPAPLTLPWQSSIFSGGVKSIRQAGMGNAVKVHYTGPPAPFGYISNPDEGTPGANFAINTSYMLCEITLKTQSASSLRMWQNLTPPFTPPYPGQVPPFAGPQIKLPLGVVPPLNAGDPFPFFEFYGIDAFLRDYTPDRLADYASATPPPLRVFKPEPLQNFFLQIAVPANTYQELVWASDPFLSGLLDQIIQTSADQEWHFPTWTAYREDPSQEFSIDTNVRLRVANGDVRFIFPVDSTDVRYLISVLTQADLPPNFDFNQDWQMYAFIPLGEGFKSTPFVQGGYLRANIASNLDKAYLLRENLSIDGTNRTMQIGIGSDIAGDCEIWLFPSSKINFENPTQGMAPTWKISVTKSDITRFISAELDTLGIDNVGSMVIRPSNKPNANVRIDYVRFR